MDFFEARGLCLKTERGNRVFPVSDKASDVVSCLLRAVRESGVKIRNAAAIEIVAEDRKVCAVKTAAGEIACGFCVLATGGLSYPKTGSTGDGYRMAQALGHTIVRPKASLVPLEASPELCARLQGLSLKNVSLRVLEGKDEIYSDFGEMLFTHFGVSGPLILSASSHMRNFPEKTYSLIIDLKPALDDETLDRRILRDFGENANRDLLNGLDRLLPQKLIPVIIDLAGIPPHMKIHSITKDERIRLIKAIKSMRLAVLRPPPDRRGRDYLGRDRCRGNQPENNGIQACKWFILCRRNNRRGRLHGGL